MATPESAYELLMRRARDLPEATWAEPGDLGRRSIEAMVASQIGDARDLLSRGMLRLSGAGVAGHSAPLSSVGQVALQWQRAVSAVGASLEGLRTSAGRLPEGVVQRTTLMLRAAPVPGSVILELTPKSNPLVEVAPEGMRPIFDPPRPLSDLATGTLIELLQGAVNPGPDASELGAQIRQLGARVASTVKVLASTLDDSHFDLDAVWMEPGQPTARVSLSAGTAGWLAAYVTGEALDSYEDELSGVVHTVSDVAKWLIETSEGRRSVDASELPPEDIGLPRVGQTIRLRVRVQSTERPDGSSSVTLTALELQRLM